MATGSIEETDEELRLTYVAMTRAREFLYVLWPMRYFHRPAMVSDRHGYAQRSRFLTEEVVEAMEHVKHKPRPLTPDRPLSHRPGVDIAGRLQDLWQ
jgi:DNA helicase-2/ATP-dependent DNA helicase PcrA